MGVVESLTGIEELAVVVGVTTALVGIWVLICYQIRNMVIDWPF